MTKPVTLTVTEHHGDGDTWQEIEQTGQLGEDIHWTAEAMSDDHGRIAIDATIYDERGLDDLIGKLQLLRSAVRQVHEVCGF